METSPAMLTLHTGGTRVRTGASSLTLVPRPSRRHRPAPTIHRPTRPLRRTRIARAARTSTPSRGDPDGDGDDAALPPEFEPAEDLAVTILLLEAQETITQALELLADMSERRMPMLDSGLSHPLKAVLELAEANEDRIDELRADPAVVAELERWVEAGERLDRSASRAPRSANG